jgi:hypothetical protein
VSGRRAPLPYRLPSGKPNGGQSTVHLHRLHAALAAPHDGVRLRDGLGYATRVFAAVWAGWALLGLLGVLIVPSGTPVSVPGHAAHALTPGWHNLLTAGDRADALWYQRIADSGYRTDDSSAAFFPLYPAVVHAVSALPGVGTLLAATVVAQACFLAALVVLHALTTREFGPGVARRATVYTAIFPTAFFFLAPYTEAPFLLLALLTFWYARGNRWGAAVVPAALAGLTRSVAVVLVVALAVEAIVQWRRSGRRLTPRLLAAAAPAAGMGVYALYWAAVGDATAPLDAQTHWQRVLVDPLDTVVRAVEYAWRFQSYWLIDLLVVGVVVAAVAAGVRRLPASYLAYAVASLLLPLVEQFPDRPLMSMPRFVAVVFPAFWVIASAVERGRLPESGVAAVFGGGYVLLGLLFVNHYFIF